MLTYSLTQGGRNYHSGTGGPRIASHDLAPAFCFRLDSSKLLQLFPEQGRAHYPRYLWDVFEQDDMGAMGLRFIQSCRLSCLWWCVISHSSTQEAGAGGTASLRPVRGRQSLRPGRDGKTLS